jgi:hypothetical protein
MISPTGAIVRLYVDLVARVDVGHWIRTETGRVYEVIAVRRQTRGKHVGRQHLMCIVLGNLDQNSDITDADVIHEIRWYKRKRKRAA